MPPLFFVYILQCRDGTYYTGMTPDLRQRLQLHNQGRGAKYTSGRRPVRLRYFEKTRGKSAALKREYALKQIKRTGKTKLIRGLPPEALKPYAGDSANRNGNLPGSSNWPSKRVRGLSQNRRCADD